MVNQTDVIKCDKVLHSRIGALYSCIIPPVCFLVVDNKIRGFCASHRPFQTMFESLDATQLYVIKRGL